MQPGAWVGICRGIDQWCYAPMSMQLRLKLPAPAHSRPSDRPQQSGHPWQSWPISSCLQSQVTHGVQLPKGEEASATGDGMNNWDMSTGTRWDGGYGLWESFWNSIQGLAGIPWGASVVWKPCACGNNSIHLVCASEGLRAAWVRKMS